MRVVFLADSFIGVNHHVNCYRCYTSYCYVN